MSVDLDAVSSAWLIRRFLPGWENAELKFVPAGSTLDNKPPDENPEIIHVDTGMGKFDHHQLADRNYCAANLVLKFLVEDKHVKKSDREALSRITDFVLMDDNFHDVFLPNPDEDRYDFLLHRVFEGFKTMEPDDEQRCEMLFKLFDGLQNLFKNKIKAEEEIKKGYVFKSNWGKSIAMETSNNDSVKLAMKKGYDLVIRKDREKGSLTVKTLPKKGLDLTALYEKLRETDSKATWFLHVSKNMLLNGSTKNPNMIPTTLTLQKVIEIVTKI